MGGPELEGPLLEYLTQQGWTHTVYRHPPVMTVAEAKEKGGNQPGLHVKNMFLKAKNKNQKDRWIVTVPEDAKVDLKVLGKTLGAKGGCSFARDLEELLGITPGAVTPFAVFNDRDAKKVTTVVAKAVVDGSYELVNAHPLHNEATVGIAPADLLAFLKSVGHEPVLIEVDGTPAAATGGADAASATAAPTAAAAAASVPRTVAWTVPSDEQQRMSVDAMATEIAKRYLTVLSSRLGESGGVGAAALQAAGEAQTRDALASQLKRPLYTLQNQAQAGSRSMFS
jgi:Ala-tRNA(Pro) deacylase|eukprot:COSAG02_NODE_4185_length_5653_cov_9.004861_2_plen_283_part_00